MPANDEDLKAKLIEYKENSKNKTDAAAETLHSGIDEAREGTKDTIEEAKDVAKDVAEDADQLRQSALERVEHYGDVADQRAAEYLEMVKASASNAQVAFDDGLGAASDAVKSGVAEARFQYTRAQSRGEVLMQPSPSCCTHWHVPLWPCCPSPGSNYGLSCYRIML